MESATSSEYLVALALAIGIAAMSLTLAMLGMTFVIHALQVTREQRNEQILQLWRPILTRSVESVPAGLPRLRRSHVPPFLNLWIHLQESFTGAAKDNLNELARRCGVVAFAKRMFEKGRMRQKLMAIAALGHLKEKSVWYQLIPVAESRNPLLSLAAVRALIQIDPKGSMRILTGMIASRTDWAPSRIIAMLREAGPDVTSAPVGAAALRAPASQAPRLIRYLSGIHSDYAMETVALIMRTTDRGEVVAACLELLNDPRDVEMARMCIGHPDWHIRVQAAAALGRIGAREDVDLLVMMLQDKEWWVRYKAAQALAELPFAGKEKLKEIESEMKDPTAKDILRHVIGEQDLA